MKFERSDVKMIINPIEADIIDGFNGFGEEDEDDFAVLSKNEMTYIQAALSHFEDEGFILEYQEGSIEQHYTATEKRIPKEAILSAFFAYLKGDASWKNAYLWEKTDFNDDDI